MRLLNASIITANMATIEPSINSAVGVETASASAPMGRAPIGIRPKVIQKMLVTLPSILYGVLWIINVLFSVKYKETLYASLLLIDFIVEVRSNKLVNITVHNSLSI